MVHFQQFEELHLLLEFRKVFRCVFLSICIIVSPLFVFGQDLGSANDLFRTSNPKTKNTPTKKKTAPKPKTTAKSRTSKSSAKTSTNRRTTTVASKSAPPKTKKTTQETEMADDVVITIPENSAETARFVKPSEIPSGTAEIGDRKTNPVGRLAVTAENPNVLLGHTVKGRYLVIGRLRQDKSSILFLTKDNLSNDKKAFVRVLLGEDDDDNFTNKLYAEERVSLSHINHPNILRVIDSGVLPEGKPFIVTNYVEGKTLTDLLVGREQFNALRTARIINQAAAALGEVHQNDILHRRLSPEDIILTVSEEDAEQVKITNFGIFEREIPEQNLAYAAPKQLEGNSANIAADIYSLAVIAYQMLTGRLSHNGDSRRELLKSVREGLRLPPSNMRLDVPPSVDEILEKAMSPDASQRYPKARDFGDAFFNAISTVAPWEKEKTEIPTNTELFELDEIDTSYITESKVEKPETVEEETIAETIKTKEELPETAPSEIAEQKVFSPILMPTEPLKTDVSGGLSTGENIKPSDELEIEKETDTNKIPAENPADEPAWKRRSIEAKKDSNWKVATFSLLGIVTLIAVVAGIFYFFANRPPAPVIRRFILDS